MCTSKKNSCKKNPFIQYLCCRLIVYVTTNPLLLWKKMKKLYAISTLSALLLSPLSVHANVDTSDIEISANVGFSSEYSFRGIAQSNENPAIQGGFDITHDSGLYIGTWGSNVNFNDGNEAQLEVDIYGGYNGSVSNFNYGVGVIYYSYPGADSSLNYDFWEAALSLGYDFDVFSASASVNFSPEYFGDSGNAVYYSAGVDLPLPADFSLSSHIGYQTIDDNAAFGVPDYADWSIGLGYKLSGFDLSLKYVDTDLEEPSECQDGCDSRIIFSISRNF